MNDLHPDPQLLQRYALGELSDEQSCELDSHLSECDECERTLDNLALADETLQNALRQPRPEDPLLREPKLDSVLERVAAFGHAPVGTAAVSAADEAGVTSADGDLGTIGVYRLLAELGAGGMGQVYKALHTKLKRIVALKVLPAERLRDPHAVSRFEREMEAVGRLEHPHIIRAIDAGETDGTHYLVMEYVEGCDLSALSRTLGPLPIADACELARQAAVGLQCAHEHGLVHRDIKPANLMLAVGQTASLRDHGGTLGTLAACPTVKILDLGLALLSDIEDDGGGLTSTGQIMGTLDYIAPEQAGDSHHVDIRADLYSLGATLYKLLIGQSIYHGQAFQTGIQKLSALATQPAPPIQSRRADVPDELAAIVHRLLAKDPAERFATPAEAAAALTPFAAGADLAALAARMGGEETSAFEMSPQGTQESAQSRLMETDVHVQPSAPHAVSPTVVLDAESPLAGSHPHHATAAAQRISRRTPSRPRLLVALGGLAALVLVAAVFYFQTDHGTLVVEIDDPEGTLKVAVAGQDVVVTDPQKPDEPIRLRAGQHKLHVTRGDLSFESDAFTLRRGERLALSVKLVPGEVRVVRTDRNAGEHLLGRRDLPRPPVPAGDKPAAVEPIAPWQPTPEQQRFLDSVAKLPPEAQVAAVAERLRQVNNVGYDITVEHRLAAGEGDRPGTVQHVRVLHRRGGGYWKDVPNFQYWPLAALREVTSLDVLIAPDLDVSPLTRLPIEQLTSVAVTPFHPRAEPLVRAFPKLKSINGAAPKQWLARRQEIDELRQVLPALSPNTQLERVVAKLVEYNPGYDGTLSGQNVTGTEVRSIRIERQPLLVDLSPLAALPELTYLHCAGTRVSDLSPLAGMPLTSLRCYETLVSDLSPLAGLPLTYLDCNFTPVSDLAPLAAMPLTTLHCSGARVSDLSPLAGMPLTSLSFHGTPVSDLSPLAGLPLTYLDCGGTPVSDLSPLAGMPLTSLNCEHTLVSDLSPLTGLPLTNLNCAYTRVSDLSPLAGLPLMKLECRNTRVSDLSPLVGMPLTYLHCGVTPVTDLSPLKGMPLTYLNIYYTPVLDLSPLAGMPLTELHCGNTPVTDLSPLAGLPLTTLNCQVTLVSDLSPLAGMPLTALGCNGTTVSDLSPLAGMPLELLTLDFPLFEEATEKRLRSLPLKTIGLKHDRTQPADAFWNEVAARRAAARAFAAETAQLPPDEQIAAVAAKLKELNGADRIGALGRVIEGDAVTEVTLGLTDQTTDVTPLLAFTRLKKLTLTGGRTVPNVDFPLLDLSCLKFLPLEELTCHEEIAHKNAPTLRGIETLKTLNGRPAGESLDSLLPQ